jgi:hypothetical protein
VIHILGELLRAPSVKGKIAVNVYLYFVYCCPEKSKNCDLKYESMIMCYKREKSRGPIHWCVNVLLSILYRKISPYV